MSRYKLLRLWSMVLIVVGVIGDIFPVLRRVLGALPARCFLGRLALPFPRFPLRPFLAPLPHPPRRGPKAPPHRHTLAAPDPPYLSGEVGTTVSVRFSSNT